MTSLKESVYPSFTNPSATSLRPLPSASTSSTSSTSTSTSMAASPSAAAASSVAAWDYNTLEEWLSVHDSLVFHEPSNNEDGFFEVAPVVAPAPSTGAAAGTAASSSRHSPATAAVASPTTGSAPPAAPEDPKTFVVTYRDEAKKVVLSQKTSLQHLALVHQHLVSASAATAASPSAQKVPKIPLPYTTIAFFFSSQKPFSLLGPEIVVYLKAMFQCFGVSFLFTLFDSEDVFSLVQPVPQHTQQLMEEGLAAKVAEMSQLGPDQVEREAEIWEAWEATEAELHNFRKGWLLYKRKQRRQEFENASDNLDFVENNEELLQARRIQAEAKAAWEKSAEELRDYSQDRAERVLATAQEKLDKWTRQQADQKYILHASKTLWNAKLYLAEVSLAELDDQIFEVKKTLEEYSAEYQEYLSDDTARQIIFENAKAEELKLLKLEFHRYETKSEKFKCHREISNIDLQLAELAQTRSPGVESVEQQLQKQKKDHETLLVVVNQKITQFRITKKRLNEEIKSLERAFRENDASSMLRKSAISAFADEISGQESGLRESKQQQDLVDSRKKAVERIVAKTPKTEKKSQEKPSGLKRPPMFLKNHKKATPKPPAKPAPHLTPYDPNVVPNTQKAAAADQALPSFIPVPSSSSSAPSQSAPAPPPPPTPSPPPPPPPPSLAAPAPPAPSSSGNGASKQANQAPTPSALVIPKVPNLKKTPPPAPKPADPTGIDLKTILNARKALKPAKPIPKPQDDQADFLKNALNRFQRCLDPNIAAQEENAGEGSSGSDFDDSDLDD